MCNLKVKEAKKGKIFADYQDPVGSVGVWLSVGGYLSEVSCQVHNGCFHQHEADGWQVVLTEIIQALALILLVNHDWMNK